MIHQRSSLYQSGFAAIAAVVVLTVLAGMGAFMVSFSNTEQLSAASDIQGTRAYWAANAGIDWALGALTASNAACPSSPPTTVDTGATFNLSVTCTVQTYAEGGVSLKVFELQSTATYGVAGSLGYVERSVTAKMETP